MAEVRRLHPARGPARRGAAAERRLAGAAAAFGDGGARLRRRQLGTGRAAGLGAARVAGLGTARAEGLGGGGGVYKGAGPGSLEEGSRRRRWIGVRLGLLVFSPSK